MLPSSPKLIRILVADDHPILRQGLVVILNDQPDMSVIAEVDNGQQAIEQFRSCQPDVAIIDVQMPEVGGVEAIKTIRAEFPDAAIIMFSIYETDEDIYQGLRAGAKAYLLKDTPCQEILK
jgi:two-component system, NarL family, response regulator